MEHAHPFRGTHILGEFYGVERALLNDGEFLKDQIQKAIQTSGATLCSLQMKKFEPGGLTILALLSESHTSIHSYPEFGALFFDAFTCGDHCNPENIAKFLVEALAPRFHKIKKIHRGTDSEDLVHLYFEKSKIS